MVTQQELTLYFLCSSWSVCAALTQGETVIDKSRVKEDSCGLTSTFRAQLFVRIKSKVRNVLSQHCIVFSHLRRFAAVSPFCFGYPAQPDIASWRIRIIHNHFDRPTLFFATRRQGRYPGRIRFVPKSRTRSDGAAGSGVRFGGSAGSVWPRTVGAVLQRICSLSRSVGADRTGADIWSAIKP